MQGPVCLRRIGKFTPSASLPSPSASPSPSSSPSPSPSPAPSPSSSSSSSSSPSASPSSSLVVVLLLLPLTKLSLANGSCVFPSSWAGEWYQYAKPAPVAINATNLAEKTCVERKKDKYIVYGDNCYQCMIINGRHENVIQYRESWCNPKQTDLEDMCQVISSDDTLYSMFRMNAKPIPCPFSGPPFTFTYSRGYGECLVPESRAERCTDESKLLLKYQACPDVDGTESNTEELQCLAVWNDGRNKYLVGTLKGRTAVGSGKTHRCFLYEEKPHHQGKVVYLLAQSGDPTCNGLTTVSEGSLTIKLTKADKEHGRCKYPSWVTQHHDWHSLDGTKIYHITNKNATLKVRVQDSGGGYNGNGSGGGRNESEDGADGGDPNDDTSNEEKIVCHNLEKLYPNDNMQGHKVKLIAHVTSGCDIGYVCMIFHRRDGHVIELQQSDQKAVMPEEACSLRDPATMPYITLITSFLHERRCPQPGRYGILDFVPSPALSTALKRQRRDEKTSNTVKRRTWLDESNEEDECRSTNIQIGCSSPEQNEIIISNTCEEEGIEYSCHGSWEEKGTWYTIISRRNTALTVGLGQTFCFALRPAIGGVEKLSGRSSRSKVQEQEFCFSRPSRFCQRDTADDLVYRLVNRGVCEDVMKVASTAAFPSLLSRLTITMLVSSISLHVALLR